MKYSTQEKYDWLLKQLKVTDIAPHEGDALISLVTRPYFQFDCEYLEMVDVDIAIELAMEQEV